MQDDKHRSKEIPLPPSPYVLRQESMDELLRIGLGREQEQRQQESDNCTHAQVAHTQTTISNENLSTNVIIVDQTEKTQWRYASSPSDTFLENVTKSKTKQPHEQNQMTLKLRKSKTKQHENR
jgi:hypothetical protein